MGNIKLFGYEDNKAIEIKPHFAEFEKDLQKVIEKYLFNFLEIHLLAHEYHTTFPQRGFIDTLGIDENDCPVIIEYKRFNNDNIISQGLYYLDWLMTHKAEFEKLVMSSFGAEKSSNIEFENSRIICMASAFSRYDEYAVRQISRNIELIRYKFFNQNMILLELINQPMHYYLGEAGTSSKEIIRENIGIPASLQERIRNMSSLTEELYFEVLSFSENLGDDINIRFLKHYVALSRSKIFLCIQPMKNSLKLWLNLDPNNIKLEEGFTRDVTEIGHHASGNLEIEIQDDTTFQKAQPYIELAYQRN